MSGTGRATSRSRRSGTRKTAKSKSPQELQHRGAVASWLIYSVRRTIGEEKVRNEILEALLPQDSHRVLGKTFVLIFESGKSVETQQKEYYDEIRAYIQNVTNIAHKGKTILFTVANPPTDDALPETHYQTVLLTNSDIPSAIFIDPAHKANGKEGIYAPYAIEDCVKPVLVEKGFTTQWLPVSQAAQTSEEDVFCQSWSLYLLKEAVLHPGETISIPKGQLDRYGVILDFWKEASGLPTFCSVLADDYAHVIEHDLKDYLKDAKEPKKLIAEIMKECHSIRPCDFLKLLKKEDVE